MACTQDDDSMGAVLGWHRVCLNTIVRATKELESARLRILPMGSRVNVVEVVGRRVRIDQPIDGWCSIESSNGDLILSPTQADEPISTNEGIQSPPVDAQTEFMQQRAQDLTKELAELRWLRAEFQNQNESENENKQLKNQVAMLTTQNEKATSELESSKAKIARLTERLGHTDSEQETTLIALVDEKNNVEKQLEELKTIAKQRSQELQRIKHKMGHMADSFQSPTDETLGNNNIPSSHTSEQTIMQNGDVVLMRSGDIVIVRYTGPVHWDEGGGDYIGVEMSDPMGQCNGTIDSTRYFECPEGCGQFFKIEECKKKIPAEFLLQKLHMIMKERERAQTAAE